MRIGNGAEAVELCAVRVNAARCFYNVAELANARGFNQNPVGLKFVKHFFERCGEITHKAAANAAGIHLGHLDAGVLHKAAVNAYFAEFVFDKHKLFAGECLLDKLFDKRGLAGTQKA